MVPGPDEGGERDELGGHAARGRDRSDAALERSDTFFKGRDGWVTDPGVDVAVLLEGEEVCGVPGVIEDERRCLVDRYGSRARRRVGCASGVEGSGAEPEGVLTHAVSLCV